MQDVTEKIEQHKDIIDANNKSFYEMKKTKDAKQNERKYVGGLSYILSPLSFCAGLLSVVRSRGQRNRFFYSCSCQVASVKQTIPLSTAPHNRPKNCTEYQQ